ncbi:MAG TPA: SAM-dependent methyltransferase [Actinomycetota bacterium]|nr:SAM-dependent methyltransferase [Actinomycetota bacterium]
MITLKSRLIAHIRANGPVSFAEYMTAALYDPDDGFYARPPVGAAGDFVTSPHVSAGFGLLLSRQIEGMWRAAGEPADYVVTEVGAGDGTLAAQIRGAAAGGFAAALRYRGVEVSAGARAALEQAGIEAAASLTELAPAAAGCILAHELLDNLPFHRLRARGDDVVEVFVAERDGALIEIEGPPSADAVAALRWPMLDGEERPVSPAALRFLHAATGMLERGHVLIYDYGFGEGERSQPVRAYEGQRVHDRLYDDPGSADITAGVDFGALVAEARSLGLSVRGPAMQRDVLKALGFDDWFDDLRARRRQAEADRDSRAILRLLSEQSRAPLLTDPAHLGAHLVLAAGIGDAGSPPGFGEGGEA